MQQILRWLCLDITEEELLRTITQWRLERQHKNGSNFMIKEIFLNFREVEFSCAVSKCQVKYYFDFQRQSLHLLILQTFPILASPLSCVLLWSVAFHESQLKPADRWASRKDHISASRDSFSILSEAVHLIQSVRSQGQRSQGKDPHLLQLGLHPTCHLHFTAAGDFVYQLTQRESTPK